MRVRYFSSLVAVLLCLFPAFASAQVADVKNPSAVEFTPSVDHAAVDSYEMDILKPDKDGVVVIDDDGSGPLPAVKYLVIQTLNLGKPAPNASNVCEAPLNVQPVSFGKDYRVRLRAIAGTSASDYTVSLNKFERAPGSPSKGIVK